LCFHRPCQAGSIPAFNLLKWIADSYFYQLAGCDLQLFPVNFGDNYPTRLVYFKLCGYLAHTLPYETIAYISFYLQWVLMALCAIDLNSLLSYMVFGENTMNGMNMLEGRSGPTTQNTDSVKTLLTYMGRSSDPMPIFVELKGNVRLTRSKKGDCYYTTTLKDCSCKARTFNPGTPCKHMKALQAEIDNESIAPIAKWSGGRNGPVDPDELKVVA